MSNRPVLADLNVETGQVRFCHVIEVGPELYGLDSTEVWRDLGWIERGYTTGANGLQKACWVGTLNGTEVQVFGGTRDRVIERMLDRLTLRRVHINDTIPTLI